MKKLRIAVAFILLLAFAANLTGCMMSISATDLMADVDARYVSKLQDLSSGNIAFTDFAVRLFRESVNGDDNTFISPLSVICALAMTANGAKGNTLNQMEQVLGADIDELNLYLYTYLNSLPEGEKYKLNIANSIWFTEDSRFTVNRDFLGINADYYGASVYKAPFDNGTVRDINNWVKKETDGMIDKVIEDIPSNAIMYLINALVFEAEWAKIYERNQVRDGTFTKEDGTQQNVEFMYSTESKYFSDENSVGFLKYYKDRKYAFAAILPEENISIAQYLDTINGESISEMLDGAEYATVKAAIPKFDIEYSIEMFKVLSAMGMTDAFDALKADFSGLGTSNEGNIYIDSVIHKTAIKVSEKGTKAGAVTVVANGDSAADPSQEKRVYLDRPFVYMIIDCENNVPIFIGAMMDME